MVGDRPGVAPRMSPPTVPTSKSRERNRFEHISEVKYELQAFFPDRCSSRVDQRQMVRVGNENSFANVFIQKGPGRFSMVKQSDKVDIFTVANLASVSPATVSRAFNHPHLVRWETRKRIEKVIEESGYIRNRAAQAMHGKRSGTIGLIVPTVTNAIFSEMIQSFTDAISENGFTLLMATHGFNLRKEYEILPKVAGTPSRWGGVDRPGPH